MYGNCSKCDFSMCFCRQTSPWAMRFSLLFFLVFLSVLYLSPAQGKSLMCPVYYVNRLWHWPKKGSILFLWFLHAFFYVFCNWVMFISFGKYLQDLLFLEITKVLLKFTGTLVHFINTAGVAGSTLKTDVWFHSYS